ncbi:MAG: hypothetical protein JST73_02865 [Actinobacteria bacterium]|nr:hypothetical protein [Actinomycetota bacterium]
MMFGGLFMAMSVITTQVGLGPADSNDGSAMPISCGSQIEWVIGGGPAAPQDTFGMSGTDARALCHAHYDSEVGGWTAKLVGGILFVLVGLAAGAAIKKEMNAPEKKAAPDTP